MRNKMEITCRDCGRFLGMDEGWYDTCEMCKIEALVQKIRDNLSPDLLKSKYKNDKWPAGHCYVASECFYHVHGKHYGYKPYCAKLEDGNTHWWLQRGDAILDLTADQFDKIFDYDKGHKQFFVSYPSKRCLTLTERVKDVSISDS